MDKNLDIQIDGARDRIKVYYETKSGHDEADKEGDKALEETAVLRCIEANSEITQKEMASTIRKSKRPVKTLTSTLVEKGILVRKNGRRNGWWEINSQKN